MSSSRNTGYQGFVSHSQRPPPSLKPGDSAESLAGKYNQLVDGFAESRGSLMCEMRNTVTSHQAGLGLKSSDYKVPDRRGISANFETTRYTPKRMSNMTMSRQSYTNFDSATVKRAPPPEWWTKSMEISDAVNTRHLKSSYQYDMGMDGENPMDRPFTAKTSMASTTMDLCTGTTKSTYHIPGYSGHIPCANGNPDAVAQADGAAHRVPVSTLRLYHRHNLPGYAGHNPNNAMNDKGPRYTGTSILTTSGASAHGEVL